MDINFVDSDFLETYKVHLLAGRDFSTELDAGNDYAFILNETAVNRLGLPNKEATLGLHLRRIRRDTQEAPIVGVVGDYHFQSLHQTITPMV